MKLRLALLLLGSACVSHWSATRSPLNDAIRQELGRAPPLAPANAPLAPAKVQFLFVGGFLNETIPGYFTDNMAVVHEELGADTSTLFPPSAGNLEDDAVLVRDTVNQLFDARPLPVVLFTHSKGAAAAVLAVLRFPELVSSGRVERIIAIQGAFKGSPVADGLVTSLPMPILHGRFQGLWALSRSATNALFTAELRKSRDAALSTWLERRVFFVRSHETSSDVAPELLPTWIYLSKFGANDGLLLEDAMKLDGVGVDLGVLKGDHAAFTVSSAMSNSTTDERRAFTRALLSLVFATP